MISYLKERCYQGRFPVPLRYVVLSFLVLFLGAQIWPEAVTENNVVTNKAAAKAAYAAAPWATVKASGLKLKKEEPASPAGPSERIQAILATHVSAAGRPLKVEGVYLPEPRPAAFTSFVVSDKDIADYMRFLTQEGATPQPIKIKSGDTLETALMSALKVSYDEIQYLTGAYAGVQDMKDLRPGQVLNVYTVPGLDGDILMALEIQRDVLTNLTAIRTSKNRFSVAEIIKPAVKTIRAAHGMIDNSLYLAANSQGVPDRHTVELIRAYSWSIDFQRDIRQNDQFEILYEEYRTEDGELVPGKGEILYASLKIGNRPYTMYSFEADGKKLDYYEADGHSVRKALMTTPINGARISSGFGMRKHPVLGYSKMHKGVDFAAPRGTPIYASGDGVIEHIGRYGSFGNYIRIRHRNNLKSAYAHMKGFKSGLTNGARVRQGDIIGYVGTTGRSTGPHLHYEVHLNGKQVNPKSVKLPTGEKLTGQALAAFKAHVQEIDKQLAEHGLGKTVVAANDAKDGVETN